jgi:branched-chain amino acid transport system permease protein
MTDTLLLPELNWLILGLTTALIVLGLLIIFGLLDMINIAHGEFFMAGTVLTRFKLDWAGNF